MGGKSWAWALIAGSAIMFILMVLHPSQHAPMHVGGSGGHEIAVSLSDIVHFGAITIIVVIAFGTVGLTARLGFDRPLALAGLVFFFFAAVATVLSASMSGLVAPKVFAVHEKGVWGKETLSAVASLEYWIHQAFAKLHAVGESLAIVLWSAAWPSSHWSHLPLRAFGVLAGLGIILAMFAGQLAMDLHGVVVIAGLQGAWLIGAALLGMNLERQTP